MASGQTLLVFTPLAFEPSATQPYLGLRNNHPILNYSDSANNNVYYTAVCPRNYSGNGMTVKLHWTALATTGAVVWSVQFEKTTAFDIDGATALPTNTVLTTTSATSGIPVVSTIAVTHANTGSLSAGDLFRISVQRNGADVPDNLTGNAELLCVELYET